MSELCLNEEFASAFVEGSLTQAQTQDAEAHMDSCGDCQVLVAMLVQVEDVLETGGEAPKQVVSPGDKIGRFTIVSIAGHGAMSVVYEAHDADLERVVAIKLMRTSREGQADPLRSARFLKEARTLARLSHENVIGVHEVGTHHGQVFIAMEFVRGRTLGEWRREDTPSSKEIVEVFLRAGQGLQAAHEAGLVHRDFKPDNVLLGDDGRVRVSDFGLAQIREASQMQGDSESLLLATQTKECVGTPAYMPPEQWHGTANAKSDQFSFCVTMYECLCGVRPFSGQSIAQLLAATKAGRIGDSVSPAWLHRILVRGLAADPSQRFESMDDLLRALRQGAKRRNKRIAGAMAVAALSLAVLAGNSMASSQTAASCASASAPVQKAWSNDQKSLLKASLLASENRFASKAWPQIESHFNRYARQWSATSTEVCTRKQAKQYTPELSLLMEDCLADSLQDFGSVVELLVASNGERASQSVKIASSTRSPTACADASKIAGRRPRAPVNEQMRGMLSKSRAFLHVGKFKQSLELSQKANKDAQLSKDRESEVESLVLACGAALQLNQVEEGKRLCHDAALRASGPGYARERAQAWTNLVNFVGGRLSDFEEANLWARYAQAALAESGGDADIAGSLAGGLGVMAKLQARHEEAKAHYQESIALLTKAFGADDLRVAKGLNNLAILLGVMGERSAALGHHQRALTIKRKALGEAHPSVAVSLINIGLLHSAPKPLQALDYYQQAIAICDASLPLDHPYIAAILNNVANVERRLGKYEEAYKHLERASEIMRARYSQKSSRLATVLYGMALVRKEQGQLQESVTVHQNALAMREAVYDEPHQDTADSHNGLGFVLIALEQHQEALSHFEQGLAIRRKVHGDEHLDLAWDLLGVGVSYIELGQPALGLKPLEEARALLLSATDRDASLHAGISFQIAVSLRAQGRAPKRALSLAREALATYESLPGQEPEGAALVRVWLQ